MRNFVIGLILNARIAWSLTVGTVIGTALVLAWWAF